MQNMNCVKSVQMPSVKVFFTFILYYVCMRLERVLVTLSKCDKNDNVE